MYRTLTNDEKALLQKLLSADFPGKNELVTQIENASVQELDKEGSLQFKVETKNIAPVKKRIPIEAQFQDEDGVWVHALLHVVKGKINELEIYKDDSSLIIKKPSLNDWELVQL